MIENYTVMGTLIDGKTVALDEAIPIASGRVKMLVEPLPVESADARDIVQIVSDEMQRRRANRNYVPRTREEIDRAMREERDGWNDRP